jgi:putative inorganic carbon (hco3(-)) transporter
LSDLLAGAGVLIAAGSAAAAMLLPPGRIRAVAMLAALVLSPVLILGDQWDSRQIVDLRDEPLVIVGLGAAALAGSVALAFAFRRWPVLLPLAIVFALPLRIPLESGGDTANLLVPLYLVIAGGVLTMTARAGGAVAGVPHGGGRSPSTWGRAAATGPARLLPLILAAVVLLYALQTLYSPDFSKSLQNVCFFFVPFSLVYALLREVEWDRRLLTLVLWVVALEAVAFVVVGSIEYVTKSLFWNDQVIRSNEFHTYFRVNSIFWDPNIYGRYLALVITIAMAALLWAKERRTLALLTGLVAVLWLGLVPTFSQSSFAALLAGLAVLAALRWNWRWALGAVGVAAVAGVLVVLFTGGNSTISPDRINIDTGGRFNLISGGTELFAQRPVWGYGAGSFPRAYREHIATKKDPVSVSHTQPVTVAAEQGIIGLAAYLTLLVVALWTMASGLFAPRAGGAVAGVPHGGGRSPSTWGRAAATGPARQAVLAAFVALLVHTMAYAGFFEDPITWVLLAVGASLAAMPVRDAT